MSTEKLRILMVLDSIYPSVGGGGAETQVGTLSEYYQSKGKEVTIVAPMVKGGVQKSKDLVNGVNVYRIPYPKIRLLGGFIMLFRLWNLLAKRREQYDVIHVHIAHKMAAVCCLSGSIHKKNVIVKFTGWMELEHGILAKKQNPFIKLLRYSINKATFYQATSQEICDAIKSNGLDENKIKLIPNAVDTTRFCQADDKPGLRTSLGFGNELIGVFVGRLVTEKNLSLLIKAWTNTFTHEDKVKLLIVGDGYLKDELTKQVKDCKREKQIIFLGAKSDIKPFLQVADFSVLPSLFEGLSNTLLEYLATSLPVIGSRVSGTEDLIEDGVNGFLFESGNCSELEEKLKKMASLSEIKIASMGKNARSTVTQYAGIESVSSRLCNLYK